MEMPNTPFFSGLPIFLGMMFVSLEKMRVDVSSYLMDHVCYRVETLERYHELRASLSPLAAIVHEGPVSGRPITVFVLKTPFWIGERMISCIELPAPKEGSPFKEGWEHAEFVVDEPLENFQSRYADAHSFDTKGMGKKLNPELGLKIGGGLQVKFHELPLAQVIEIEQRQRGGA